MFGYCKKGIAWIITGSFSMILAACYGAPVNYTYYKYMKTTNPDGKPIPGLKVNPYENGNTMGEIITDQEGGFEIPIVEDTKVNDYQLVITDIDTFENLGQFKTKNVDLDTLDGDIIMEEMD